MRRHVNKKNFKRVLHLSLLLAGVMFVVSGFSDAHAQDVTQGYYTDQPLQNGLVVRIKGGDKAKVEPLTQEQEVDIFGIVISSNESPVNLSDPDAQQVFVATQGRYDVLVSTQNGQIRAGDSIVISSIEGVAMKADDLHRMLVGKALENFDGESDAESKVKISDGRTIAVGRIQIDISVKRNPSFSGDTIAGVPHALSRVAASVTDRPVTAFRIYAGLAVLLTCLVVAGAILYSGIHAGVSSVGRNPLAKGGIVKSLVTMTLTALIVVSIGLFAVYLILKI